MDRGSIYYRTLVMPKGRSTNLGLYSKLTRCRTRHRHLLAPKLQLGDADLEAPSSSPAKTELRLRGSQAGALVVIHKHLKARHSGMDCRNRSYSVPLFEKEGLGAILLDKSPSLPLVQRGRAKRGGLNTYSDIT